MIAPKIGGSVVRCARHPFDAFERLRSAVFNYEQPGDQPMSIRGYQYSAWSSGCLHPRGDVRSISE